MKWSAGDHEYMARAIRLAGQGRYSCQPNPRVGCVIVQNDEIVGTGSHLQAGKDHAEIAALKQAGTRAKGATCYVSLEPCVHTGRTPPCTESLISSGVTEIIAAMVDPNPRVNGKGLARLNDHGIKTRCGLLEKDAIRLNSGYIKRMLEGMPYVRCKLAMSIDGKTAMASGESKWITGVQARQDVQRLRAESCAVMTGIGTVLADNPSLTVREIDTLGRQPFRVVIDRNLRIATDAKVLAHDGASVIFTTGNMDRQTGYSKLKNVKVVGLPGEKDFLIQCLYFLASEMEINEVLVEAGSGLAGALLEDGLIDELVIYQAPVILGDKARDLFTLKKVKQLSDKYSMNLIDLRHVGDDLRFTYRLNKDS